MTTQASIRSLAAPVAGQESAHHTRLVIAWLPALAFTAAIAVYGFNYYTLGAAERPLSPKHALLRPSGVIGIKLGMFGTLLFFGIYFYYFRKRWGWLRSYGATKHWLDFHIVLGVTAPVVIAFHSAFKFRGIAGMAFWIMVAVALSGVVGRYLYAQIPRHLNEAELTLQELQEDQAKLTAQLAGQRVFTTQQIMSAFRLPSAERVGRQSLLGALGSMLMLDLARPFRVAALRRRALRAPGVLFSLGGIVRTSHADLEHIIQVAKRQAALAKRMLFLTRSQQVFQLWHVVHRPFSYAFVVLALLHIVTVLLLGYI